MNGGHGDVRLAELVATLSLATDLGMGQPMEHRLRSCLLAMRLAERLALDRDTLRQVFYVALLRRVGCTADSHDLQALFGDDLAAHGRVYTLDFGRPSALLADLIRHAGAHQAPWQRLGTLAGALVAGPEVPRRMFRASCEVAHQLADQLGLDAVVGQALEQTFERWDGRGHPRCVRGEAIALAARIAQVAEDAEVFHRLGGVAAALEVCRQRAGLGHDPALAHQLAEHADALFAELDRASAWDAVLDAEPQPWLRVNEDGFDAALHVMALFADLKSPGFGGHS
jgi:hypothetical protein